MSIQNDDDNYDVIREPRKAILVIENGCEETREIFNHFKGILDQFIDITSLTNDTEIETKDFSSIILFLPTRYDQWNATITSLRTKLRDTFILAVINNTVKDKLKVLLQTDVNDILIIPASNEEIKRKIEHIDNAYHDCEINGLIEKLIGKFGLQKFIGTSNAFRNAIRQIPLFSKTDSPILITGESGTGKEMVARALHYLSRRTTFPFVPVNCGAVPDQLFENELFGHERGAYTGATKKQSGLLFEAQNGTLFLDELNSLNLISQVKILRFLEDGNYKPLGSAKYYESNVRIISATNVDLQTEVNEKRFREDLFYRINVITIQLPPLRDRVGDIPILANHFLQQYARRYKRDQMYFSNNAFDKLSAYSWHGNVRELKSVVEKLVAVTTGNVIRADDIDIQVDESLLNKKLQSFLEAKKTALSGFEKNYIESLLTTSKWNITQAAENAHMGRRTIERLMKKYELVHTVPTV